MKRIKRRKNLDFNYEKRMMPLSLIETEKTIDDYDKKDLKTRAAYFLLNGTPEFSVNEQDGGGYKLLAAEKDYFAAKMMGATEAEVRIYHFTAQNAEIFSCIEKLKAGNLGAMEEAYLMERLVKEFQLPKTTWRR